MLTTIGTLRLLAESRTALVGALLVLFVVATAVLASWIAPFDPQSMDIAARFAPASIGHLLGTDEFGRDLLTRIMFGARISLLVAGSAVAIATVAGGVVGLVSGYEGGWIDLLLMRLVDVLFAIPALVMALGIVALIGPSATSVAIALGVAFIPTFARVTRSAVVTARSQPYVEASLGMGASAVRIVRLDVLPNILPYLIVQITVYLAFGVLDEATLGFLGLGVQPPEPSWGSILATGRQYLHNSPSVPLFAGIAVLVAVFGFNLLGDGLRDVLDPRGRLRVE